MTKFLLPFFILSLIPNQPRNCALGLINKDISLSTLIEKLEAIPSNITTGLLICLNSSTAPSLGCENEINNGSTIMWCLLKKFCYEENKPNVINVVKCLSTLFGVIVYDLSKEVFDAYVNKVYICVNGIYTNIRTGVTNCDLIYGGLSLNIQSALNNLNKNLIYSTVSNLVTLLKILSGNMKLECTFSR
ncbi:uncharacterized protein LOC111638018 [Centruroides sculpturatus]|uniref:uncharacterized protein LOC111638018 n=1 Tax=Centruroides sculpturatus TaxID=218467 RepID=UPI000C6E6C64|nr:uncharacterized protein LOC111638018 [Centruroides sculpturatus]